MSPGATGPQMSPRATGFTVRRMTPADKPAMMEIASKIWDGFDYLPTVFDEWVADTEGEFAAVLLDGKIVGCGKLTFLTPTDAWLEGLRKDPRVGEKGLGTRVARHFLSLLATRRDLTSIRFSTYIRNLASITANERMGFRRRTVLSVKAWEGTRAELEAVPLRSSVGARSRVETVTDETLVLDYLDRAGCFPAAGGLVVEGWRAWPFSRELVAARYVRTGHCRAIAKGRGLAGLAIWVPDTRFPPGRVKIVCVEAESADVADSLFDDIFLFLRGAVTEGAAVTGRPPTPAAGPSAPAPAGGPPAGCEVQWMVPDVERWKRWCATRGLRSEEQENDFLVYELPLAELGRWADAGRGT
jgi:RimJ/RimL family protein N-acetyltransferase